MIIPDKNVSFFSVPNDERGRGKTNSVVFLGIDVLGAHFREELRRERAGDCEAKLWGTPMRTIWEGEERPKTDDVGVPKPNDERGRDKTNSVGHMQGVAFPSQQSRNGQN